MSKQPNDLIVLSYRAEPDLAFGMLRTLFQHRDEARPAVDVERQGWNQEEGRA
ncbi:hypothetical protein [Arachnia propionica]